MKTRLLVEHKDCEDCKVCAFYTSARVEWPCDLDYAPDRKGRCLHGKPLNKTSTNTERQG